MQTLIPKVKHSQSHGLIKEMPPLCQSLLNIHGAVKQV